VGAEMNVNPEHWTLKQKTRPQLCGQGLSGVAFGGKQKRLARPDGGRFGRCRGCKGPVPPPTRRASVDVAAVSPCTVVWRKAHTQINQMLAPAFELRRKFEHTSLATLLCPQENLSAAGEVRLQPALTSACLPFASAGGRRPPCSPASAIPTTPTLPNISSGVQYCDRPPSQKLHQMYDVPPSPKTDSGRHDTMHIS
jgi:hypothetical protein